MRSAALSLLAAAAIAGRLIAPAAAADLGTSEPLPAVDTTHPFFQHRLLLQAGAAFNQLSTSAQVGRIGVSSGTSISLEDDLRFDSRVTSLDLLARLRLGERWSMEFAYFDASRSKTANISRTIEFGRLTFPANASVHGDFGLAEYRLAFGYAFHKSQTTEVGMALSLYVNDFTVAASGSASVGALAASFQSESYSVKAPPPASRTARDERDRPPRNRHCAGSSATRHHRRHCPAAA